MTWCVQTLVRMEHQTGDPTPRVMLSRAAYIQDRRPGLGGVSGERLPRWALFLTGMETENEMHSDEMSLHVQRFLTDADSLQWKKNKDYHPERVAFLEILRTCFECDITPEQDLWAKIRKQYIALHGYVIHHHAESESPRSRMMDIAVYMGMLACWEEHQHRIVVEALGYMLTVPCAFPPDNRESCGNCDRCLFVKWLYDYADSHWPS